MTAASCQGTPLSWLKLESLALEELDQAKSVQAREHLAGCAACSDRVTAIENDTQMLAPLALEEASAPWWRTRPALAGLGLAFAAAVAMLLLMIRQPPTAVTATSGLSPRVALKGGGDLVLTVVRLRGDVQTNDPTEFRDGDRFKVAVTCAETDELALAVTVEQGGELHQPLGRALSIDCGNNVLLPGAFSATGPKPITICVTPRSGAPAKACARLDPATSPLRSAPDHEPPNP